MRLALEIDNLEKEIKMHQRSVLRSQAALDRARRRLIIFKAKLIAQLQAEQESDDG